MASRRTFGLIVATVALVVGGFSSAGGAAATVHAPTARGHVHVRASKLAGTATASSIGAGYWVVPGTPNVSSASAQFTVPRITCSKPHDAEGVFPGIYVYDGSNNLVQQIDVNLFCSDGVIHMVDVVCIAGSQEGCETNLTISPGDRIIATFSESPYHTQGQIYDLTTNQEDSIFDGTPAPTNDYSVFIGDAGPAPFGFSTHVPKFKHIAFSKGQVDGYYLFEYFATATFLKTAKVTQIKTSALTGDGDAFDTTFAHI